MGFFDWMLKGLGVESDDSNKKKKNKKSDNGNKDKYMSFNLHEKNGVTASVSNPIADSINLNAEHNLIIHEPKSHKDVQLIIDYLRQNQGAYINLANINAEDAGRILDFLSGAIYGLNGSIVRIKDDQFLLMPSGSKILKPDENKK